MSLLRGSLRASKSPVCAVLRPFSPVVLVLLLLLLGKGLLIFLLKPMLFKSVTPPLPLLVTPWVKGATIDDLRGSCNCCCCCCLWSIC